VLFRSFQTCPYPNSHLNYYQEYSNTAELGNSSKLPSLPNQPYHQLIIIDFPSNASQAYRTILFDTVSDLHTNIPVLIGWVLISVVTVSVSTFVSEKRMRRLGILPEVH
jgi:hypothetical protein